MTGTPGRYRVDVLTFRGRLDRRGFVVAPLVNFLLVATTLGLLFVAKSFVFPEWLGARLVAVGVVASLLEIVASFLSVQVRRLRDAGFGWWHVTWIFLVPPLLAQVSAPASMLVGAALNVAFLTWPSRREASRPDASGGGDDAQVADVTGEDSPLLGR